MRILIDECVHPRVKQLFRGHEVATVRDQGWGAMEDGPLLAVAQEQFDLFVTNDGGRVPAEYRGVLPRHPDGVAGCTHKCPTG